MLLSSRASPEHRAPVPGPVPLTGRGLHSRTLSTVTVTIWESDVAWAACTEEMTCP
jgi:hypothetical protein